MATSGRHLLAPSPAPTPAASDPPTPTPTRSNFGCFSFRTSLQHHLQLPARPSSASAPDSRVALSSSHPPPAEHDLFEVSLEDEAPETPRFFSSRTSFAGSSVRSSFQEVPRPSAVNGGLDAAASHRRQPSRPDGFSGLLSSASRKETSREDPRTVHINDPNRTAFGRPKREIAGNSVRTSKYTLVSFVPRNLFEQFQRVAYIYFLIIVVLNQIPPLAVFGRTASIFPLAIVLVATAVKDAYEDWARHKSDRVENNRESLVLQGTLFQSKRWMDIRVGELIKIHANEIVPADMVLLGSSEASGVAYVETMNLDGESNLKTRFAKQETSAWSPEDRSTIGPVICQVPNRDIYEFQAYLDVNGLHLPLGPNNIILRGCELKNTSWVVGVVVYAGRQTKAMLNNSGAQHKRSRLERLMNKATGYLAIFLLTLCAVGGIGMGVWLSENKKYLDELPFYRKKNYDDGEDYNYYGLFGEAVVAILSCVIVFQVMVPIALYISLELVRLWQAHFMTLDMDMYHGDSDSRFQCRALNINEDLGQVKYVFSDKTGTLTENKMEFHSASVAGVDYSDSQPMEATANGIEGVPVQKKRRPKLGTKWDPRLMEILRQPINTPERRAAHDYMLVLAACNTIVPTKVQEAPDGQMEMTAAANGDDSGLIEYQGESPDEQALVSAAASYGYELLERSFESILINVMGAPQRYQILGLHEFDSVRKRMSVVVRCPNGEVKVLVKGADSAMLDVIAKEEGYEDTNFADEKHQHDVRQATESHLEKYSTMGLRTLVVASTEIDSKQFDKWHHRYVQASTAMNARTELLREASSLVETDLCLLGATAIEDRLQAGVPETIAALREAGIKVWVLTGDKQETAISIGYSCQLLTEDMTQMIVRESTKDGALRNLKSVKEKYKIGTDVNKDYVERHSTSESNDAMEKSKAATGKFAVGNHPVSNGGPFLNNENLVGGEGPHDISDRQLALIIDGNTLVHALQPEVKGELYEVARACKVVICCRVAPFQKAAVVNLIKEKTGELTLAIGDGANDVSMIQMADVGVGVTGQEGRQAVMASDFSMGQFRFLKRLLLVHGHWNYQRLSYMLLYNFYRNAVFVFTLFWFILYTAYSPQSAITDWSLVFFSLIYTSVPTIVVATFDKNLSHRTLNKYPALYAFGQRGAGYNQTLFWMAMLDSVWQSLVLFYVPFLSYRRSDIDLYGIGCIWTFGVVLLVNLHLAMDVYRWNWLCHASIWGSIVVTFICMLVLDSLTFSSTLLINYGSMKHILGDSKFYIDILIVLPVALLPRFAAKVVGQRFFASDIQIAREAEIMGSIGDKSDVEVRALELNNLPRV